MKNITKGISVMRAFGVTTCLALALAITGCATTLGARSWMPRPANPSPGP